MTDRERCEMLQRRLEQAIERVNAQGVTIAFQAQLLADCRRWIAGMFRGCSPSKEAKDLFDRMEKIYVPKALGE